MPVWPFKKKEAEIEQPPPENISYQRSDDTASELLSDTSHTEAADYQAAMALFSSSDSDNAPKETDVPFTWVSHDDGYHYKKNSDGSFQETPYVIDEKGNYIPYS